MSNDAEIYNIGMAGYASAYDQESVNYRNAQRSGDTEEAVRAWQSMADLRVRMNSAHEIAVQNAQSMRPTEAPSKLGLSQDEIEHAKISNVSEEVYAANKERLRRMRANGTYSG